MAVYLLDEDLWFPPPSGAEEDGMLAVGGDLSPERLLLAYTNGIFPWYSKGEPILWWSPKPRFVLLPDDIKVSKSMKKIMRNKGNLKVKSMSSRRNNSVQNSIDSLPSIKVSKIGNLN